MNPRSRVLSIVESATWGRGIVYELDEDDSKTELNADTDEARWKASLTKVETVEEEEADIPQFLPTSEDFDSMCLGYFPGSLFCAILEDSMTQYKILVECNNEMRITKVMTDMPLLLALKYGVAQSPVTDELEGFDPQNLGSKENKIKKLESDRLYLYEVLKSTYVSISLTKCFRVLQGFIDKILAVQKYKTDLLEEEAKNRVTRRELAKQLRQQRNHVKTVIYDTDVLIDGLKSQIEDATLMAETRSRYVGNWQNARTEQHNQTIDDLESVPRNNIEYYKEQSDLEHRIHSEVELLSNICINETLAKVEEWMDKYEKDIEAIDLKIQIKRSEYQTMLEKRIDYEETYARHEKEMKDWNHFKDEREKARAYAEKMTKSAVIVQAWWRGLLVRRELGPYKPKKKPKGGKKK